MVRITRRHVLKTGSALALTSLGAHNAFAREITARQKELYELAKKEGEVTWYTAHSNDTTAQALGRDFEAAFPGIKANVVRTTAQVAYQRLTQEQRANAMQVDVFSSTDIGHYVTLKEKSLLEKYVPDNASKLIDVYKNYDPDGYFTVTSAGLIGIAYNTEKLKEADTPKNWTDLLDPKWKDKIALGHPGFSGYVGTWVLTMKNLYGWSYFDKLEKNKPQIGRSINDTVTALNAGERQVAAGADGSTLFSASRGNPLAVSYPTDGSVLIIAPSAIMKGTKHPNAAKLFMEYLYSVEAAKINAKHFAIPLRPEVPSPPGAKPISEIKTIRPTVADIDKGIPEVIEQWRDTFGN